MKSLKIVKRGLFFVGALILTLLIFPPLATAETGGGSPVISFDTSGGEGEFPDVETEWVEEYEAWVFTTPSETPSKNGVEFSHWESKNKGGWFDVTYPGDKNYLYEDRDRVFTAVWEKEYTVLGLSDDYGDAEFQFVQPAEEIESESWSTQDFRIWYKALEPNTTYIINVPKDIFFEDFVINPNSIIESAYQSCVDGDAPMYCLGEPTVLEITTKSSSSGSVVEGFFGAEFSNDCRIPGEYHFNWDSVNNGLVVDSDWTIDFSLGGYCEDYDNHLDKIVYNSEPIELGEVFFDGEYTGVVEGLEDRVESWVSVGTIDGGDVTILDEVPEGFTFSDVNITQFSINTTGVWLEEVSLGDTGVTIDGNKLTISLKNIPEYSMLEIGYYNLIDGVDGHSQIIKYLTPYLNSCVINDTYYATNKVGFVEQGLSVSEDIYVNYISKNTYDSWGNICIPWEDSLEISNFTMYIETPEGNTVDINAEYNLAINFDWIDAKWSQIIEDQNFENNNVVKIVNPNAYLGNYEGSGSGVTYYIESGGKYTLINSDGLVEIPYSQQAWDNFIDDQYVGKYIVRDTTDLGEDWGGEPLILINIGKDFSNYDLKLKYEVSYENNTDCILLPRSIAGVLTPVYLDIDDKWAASVYNDINADGSIEYESNKTCINIDPVVNRLAIGQGGTLYQYINTNIYREDPRIIIEVDPAVISLSEDAEFDGGIQSMYKKDNDYERDQFTITATKLNDRQLELVIPIPAQMNGDYFRVNLYSYYDTFSLIGLDYEGRIESEIKAYSYSGNTLRSEGTGDFVVSTLSNELRINKYVSKAGEENWMKTLNLGSNPTSNQVEYLLDFSSSYDFDMINSDVFDPLPENFEFEGFIVDGVNVGNSVTVSGIEAVYENGEVIVKSGNIESVEDLKFVFTGTVTGNDPIINTVLNNTAVIVFTDDGTATWSKVDERGELLGGAEFLLEGPGGYNEYISSDSGIFVISDLDFGDYILTETIAPIDYELDATPIGFTLSDTNDLINLGNIVNVQEEDVQEITFDLQGGTGDFPPMYSPPWEYVFVPYEEPVKENAVFSHWDIYSDYGYEGSVWAGGDFYVQDSDVVLEAVWEQEYEITFDLQGGTGDFPTMYSLPWEYVNVPCDLPTRDGYDFDYWEVIELQSYEEIGYVSACEDFYMPDSDVVLKAVWVESVEYMVSFDLNGGEGEFPSYLAFSGTSITLPSDVPTKDGYTFNGWEMDGEFYESSESLLMPRHDAVFTARWRLTPINPDQDGTVSIYKFKQPALEGEVGDGLPFEDGVPADWVVLPGVEFTLNKVEGLDLSSNEGWVDYADLMEDWDYNDPTIVSPYTLGEDFVKTTDTNGLVFFDDLPIGVYLVRETDAPSSYGKIKPFMLSIPFTSSKTGGWVYDVTVYPKNTVTLSSKSIIDSGAYSLGDKVEIGFEGSVPSGGVTDHYEFVDILDPRVLVEETGAVTGVVTVGDTERVLTDNWDYSYSVSDNVLKITFTEEGREAIYDAILDDADATVKMVVEAEITGVGVIENTVTLYPSSDSEGVESNTVETKWGDTFIEKVNKDGEKLSGAEFEIWASKDPLVEGVLGGVSIPDTAIQITTLEGMKDGVLSTGVDGLAVIEGLRYSDFADNDYCGESEDCFNYYFLKEVKAPTGYNLLAQPVQFTVNNSDGTGIEVVNTQTSDAPLTGGSGMWVVIVIGLVSIIGGGVIYYKNRRR